MTELEKLLELLTRIIQIMRGQPHLLLDSKGQERRGGYFSVFSANDGVLILRTLIGEPSPPENEERYYTFSKEKGERLYMLLHIGHLGSYQSRDPEKNRWGGAIWARKFIFSFSGLPELADEALMLVLAIANQDIFLHEAREIAERSNNNVFEELYNLALQDSDLRTALLS